MAATQNSTMVFDAVEWLDSGRPTNVLSLVGERNEMKHSDLENHLRQGQVWLSLHARAHTSSDVETTSLDCETAQDRNSIHQLAAVSL